MPIGSKRMWELRGKSWDISPVPPESTRKNGSNGPYSTDAVDLRLDWRISVPFKGQLVDPEQNDIRALEQSYQTVDLRQAAPWIRYVKTPGQLFWLLTRPKHWPSFFAPGEWLWPLSRSKRWGSLFKARPGMVLFPGDTVLGDTHEEITLFVNPQAEEDGTPNPRLSGRVDGKSSIARLFVIVHVTAGTIHTGTKHQIRLEIKNVGDSVIVLTHAMRICQLILDELTGEPADDGSTFNVKVAGECA